MLNPQRQIEMDLAFHEVDAKCQLRLSNRAATEAYIESKKQRAHVPYVCVPLQNRGFINQVRKTQDEICEIVGVAQARHQPLNTLHTTLVSLQVPAIKGAKLLEAVEKAIEGIGPLTYRTFGPYLTPELDVIMELREAEEKVGRVRCILVAEVDGAVSPPFHHTTVSRIHNASFDSIQMLNRSLRGLRENWDHQEIVATEVTAAYRGEPPFDYSRKL